MGRDEYEAAILLQEIEERIRDFKRRFRWREARTGLAVVLRRNLPRSER